MKQSSLFQASVKYELSSITKPKAMIFDTISKVKNIWKIRSNFDEIAIYRY